MKKVLDGEELAEFIQERQAKAVRGIRQQWKTIPKITFLYVASEPIHAYFDLVKVYADDILFELELTVAGSEVEFQKSLAEYNKDESIQAIVAQESDIETEILVDDEKDVAAQKSGKLYQMPEVMAVDWLLASVNVSIETSSIAVIGRSLFARELERQWKNDGIDVVLVTNQDSILLGDKDIIIDTNNSLDSLSINSLSDDIIVLQTHPGNGNGFQELAISALFENAITATRSTITESS